MQVSAERENGHQRGGMAALPSQHLPIRCLLAASIAFPGVTTVG
jgi:hypothetical protein